MTALPSGLRPMLATTAPLPEGGSWAFEVKWDGVRALAYVEPGQVCLRSRNGNDLTGSYPEVGCLPDDQGPLLLDGELVAFSPEGRPDFGLLQQRMHVGRPPPALLTQVPVTFLLFDVLHADGHSLLRAPYDDRRARLEQLDLEGPCWQVPPVFDDGPALMEVTRAQSMEGVVAKRRDSTYEPGRRSDCWRKVKHVRRTSAVIAGWKPGEGGRAGRIGSLLLGVPGATGLEFAGHVGTGFSAATLRMLGDRLAPLRRDASPFATPVPREHARHAVWVEPVLVADVDYAEWTRDGRLRHPSYKGLRDDVAPGEVTRE